MTYAQILLSLKDRTLTVVSDRTQIHRTTLYRMVNDRNSKRPNRATLDVLSRYLDGTAYEADTEVAE